MKTIKYKKIIILLTSIVLIVVVSIPLIVILTLPKNNKSLKIDGDTIDAQFSYLTNFVRINNKLYYNYYGNMFNSGLYEISESGTKKLKPAEVHYLPEYQVLIPSLVVNNDQFMRVFDNGFSSIDCDEIMPFYSSEGFVWNWIASFDGKIYIISSENENQNLYQYKNGGLYYICKMNRDISEFCIDESYIYYINSHNNKHIIFRQSLSNERDCKPLCEIKLDDNNSNINYFYIDNNNSYIATSSETDGGIYSTNKARNSIIFRVSKNGTAIPIYSGASVYMKLANDRLYYTDNNRGLYMYDADNDSTVKLFDGEVSDFWIVDDKYVYFCNKANKLFRVNVKEKIIEEVFG